MSAYDEGLEAGVKALVQAETNGLCEFGKVCADCDCFPEERDTDALRRARALLDAALLRPNPYRRAE